MTSSSNRHLFRHTLLLIAEKIMQFPQLATIHNIVNSKCPNATYTSYKGIFIRFDYRFYYTCKIPISITLWIKIFRRKRFGMMHYPFGTTRSLLTITSPGHLPHSQIPTVLSRYRVNPVESHSTRISGSLFLCLQRNTSTLAAATACSCAPWPPVLSDH